MLRETGVVAVTGVRRLTLFSAGLAPLLLSGIAAVIFCWMVFDLVASVALAFSATDEAWAILDIKAVVGMVCFWLTIGQVESAIRSGAHEVKTAMANAIEASKAPPPER